MTYIKEIEKAIKEYLRSRGYRYNAKKFSYSRLYTNDITHDIGFSYESHGRRNYYFLRTFVGIGSKSLNDILYEATDGKIDHRALDVGPVYHCRLIRSTGKYKDSDYIHCEFIGDRPMEENIAELERMYETDIEALFKMYNTQKSIYTCSAHEEFLPFNPVNTPCVFYYGPLGFFFDGQFKKAFDYIQKQLKIEKHNINEYGSCDEALTSIEAFKNMRNNLKSWIAERRQFKVDDEYLPRYDEMSTENGSSVHKIRSFIKELLK